MENLAAKIQQRANAVNVSISMLCEKAGVSRKWFEKLKRRIPKSIEMYNRIDEQLRLLENKNGREFLK
jgi:hypothetical protein